MTKLSGKTALVTGAGRGIGQAFAERLAADGANIVLVDQYPAADTQLLIEAQGRSCLTLQADVSRPEDVERVRQAVEHRFGGVDILVNNAGMVTEDNFETLTYASWKRIFEVNVDSVFLFTKAFAPVMQQRGWGRVVNMCTIMLALNVPDFPHYVASKGAVLGCTRAFASALGVHGITVNAISPGYIRTPGTEAIGVGSMAEAGNAPPPVDRFAMAAMMQAVKRGGVPHDLVGAMAFLVCEDASFMTGQNLIVDGGSVRCV